MVDIALETITQSKGPVAENVKISKEEKKAAMQKDNKLPLYSIELSNSWTGTTTINSGAHLTGTASSISGGNIVNNGSLVYYGPSNTTTQAISGTGDLTVQSQGTQAFTGGISQSRMFVQVGGASLSGVNSFTGTNGVTLLGGTALTVTDGASLTGADTGGYKPQNSDLPSATDLYAGPA